MGQHTAQIGASLRQHRPTTTTTKNKDDNDNHNNNNNLGPRGQTCAQIGPTSATNNNNHNNYNNNRKQRRPRQQQQHQNMDMDYTQRIPSTGLLWPAPGCQA